MGGEEVRRSRCSGCGRSSTEVTRLVAGPDIDICNYCVRELEAELLKGPLRMTTSDSLSEEETAQWCAFCGKKRDEVRRLFVRNAFSDRWVALLSAQLVCAGASSVTFFYEGASRTRVSWFVLALWRGSDPGEQCLKREDISEFIDAMCAEGVLKARPTWYSVRAITLKA